MEHQTPKRRQPIGPVKLPSGREIYFVEPLGSDRMAIMARAIAEGRQAEMMFMLNTYWLPAKCLVDENGNFVAPDYYTAFDDWPDRDLNYYREVFDQLFGWTNDLSVAAKAEAARFLPGAPTSSPGQQSPNEPAGR